MGPTRILSAPGGPHVGPMNLAIRDDFWSGSQIIWIWFVFCCVMLWFGNRWFHRYPPELLQWYGVMIPQGWWNNPDKYAVVNCSYESMNSSPPGQNGRHFADNIFRSIFINEKFCILIKISLKFVPKGPIGNNPALVKMMAWRRKGNKPSSEPMLNGLTDAYMWH